MSKSRELDPHNLGIGTFIRRRPGLQVNLMVGKNAIEMLQDGIKADSQGKVWLDEEERAIMVRPANRGRWHLVYSLVENYSGGRDTRLLYGIFTLDGQVLSDPYACVSLTGKYQNVQETFQQVTRLLS